MRLNKIKKLVSKTPLVARVVSLYAVAGLMFVGYISVYSRLFPTPDISVSQVIVFAPKVNISARQIISGHPSRMSIERLGIDLPVSDGVYNDKTGEWSLSDKAVYFATITDLPNDNQGNTFLYGHNQKSVIGRMSGIAPGDIVKIQTTNGHEFSYAYISDELVKPDKTAVLHDSPSKPRLTVMTCDGIWSQARRLMYFDLVEVK